MGERFWNLVGLAALVATVTLGAASYPAFAATDDNSDRGLPVEIRRTLDAQYPGWRFFRVAAENLPYCKPPNHGWMVSGDFDGNGELDYAVLIVHRGSEQLLAFVREGASYRKMVVPNGGESSYITLMPRGKVFHWADPDLATSDRPPPVVYFTLRNDGIKAQLCESDSSVYEFKNGKFVAVF